MKILKLTLIAATALFLLACGAAILLKWSPRYTVTLAVANPHAQGESIYSSFIRAASEDYPWVNFKVLTLGSPEDVNTALLNGTTDLAVVRADQTGASEGRTLLILRKLVVGILADPRSKIESTSDLAGKKIALLTQGPSDDLLTALVSFYGFDRKKLLSVAPSEVGRIFKDRQADVLIAVGPQGPGPIADAIQAIRKAIRAEPTFVDLEEADAFVRRSPLYDIDETPRGSFSVSPAAPEEAVKTVSVSIRLVARAALRDRIAGEITRTLLKTKASVAATIPAVADMQAPDLESPGVLAVHPGAKAYLEGEQQSIGALFVEHLYSIMFVGGLLSSGLAWLLSRFKRQEQDPIIFQFARLSGLRKRITDGEVSKSSGDEELDEISSNLFEQLASKNLDTSQFLAISNVIDQTRIMLRRRTDPSSLVVRDSGSQ